MDTKYAVCLLFWIAISFQYATVSGNRCTAVLSRNEIHEVNKQSPCVQKYEARCGWLSLNYCTFYRQTLCDKKVNETIKTYFIKTDCCSGFLLARNGSCIKKTAGLDLVKLMPLPATEDPDFVRSSVDKKKTSESDKPLISGGGYAGIICGAVLLVSVVWFIVIAVKKRRRKKTQKAAPPQTVLYVPSPTSGMVNSNSTHSQLSVLRRETTSLSSQIRTPPASPTRVAEVTIPVEQDSTCPFIAKSSPTEIGASPTEAPDSPLVITIRKGETINSDKNYNSPLPQVTETSPRDSMDLDDICEEKLESLSMGPDAFPEEVPLMSECRQGDLANGQATDFPISTRISPELIFQSEQQDNFTGVNQTSDLPLSLRGISPDQMPLIQENMTEQLEEDQSETFRVQPSASQAPPSDLQTPPTDQQTSPSHSQATPTDPQTLPANVQASPSHQQATFANPETPTDNPQTPTDNPQTPPTDTQTLPTDTQTPPPSQTAHVEDSDNEDTPLVLRVENLNNENLPESDI